MAKKIILYIAALFVAALIVAGGTFAYYTWTSSVQKIVGLNTSSALSEYIIYNGSESVFVGDLGTGSTYTDGMSYTFSIAKTETASNVDMETTITMNVDAIDDEISNSAAFYWAVTSGTSDNVGEHLASNSFTGVSEDEVIELLISKELTTDLQEYTIWIWIDDESNPSSNLVGKTLDVSIGVQVDQVYNREPGTTYAVYSEDDNSLRFYNTQETITEGSNYRGRTATAVYTGFENTSYTSASSVPWYSYRESVTSVYVEDFIYPISTAYWFYEFKTASYFDVKKIDTSNVTNMSYMFYYAGYNATSFTINGLNNWDTFSVTNMGSMFYQAGYSATTWNIGDLSGWDVSNVTDMSRMFDRAGFAATKWSIGDLSEWNVSSVTDMLIMFQGTGYSATTWNIGDLSDWNVSSVEGYGMSSMFYHAGSSATTFDIGNLDNWDISGVTTMQRMFEGAGYYSTTFNIGDLSGWNVSSVTDMSRMFNSAGKCASYFNIGNLNNWNVSGVTTMDSMFYFAGYTATTFNIGDLSSWNVSSVTDMSRMFHSAGRGATTWNIGDLSGWNVSSVTEMDAMFYHAGLTATNWSMDLSGWDVDQVTSYSDFNYDVESKLTAPSFGTSS